MKRQSEKPVNLEKEYKNLFESGDYQGAIKLLRANKESFDSALYHYNLGINHARMEQFPLARYHFEKARDNGLYSPELRESLQQVKKLTGAQVMEKKSDLTDYLYDWTLSASLYTGFNISLIMGIILLTQLKKISHLWVKLPLALIVLTPLTVQVYCKTNYSQVIVMEAKAVLAGPSGIFEQTQELTPGIKISVSENFNGWRRIVAPASHKGWVRSGKLKEL